MGLLDNGSPDATVSPVMTITSSPSPSPTEEPTEQMALSQNQTAVVVLAVMIVCVSICACIFTKRIGAFDRGYARYKHRVQQRWPIKCSKALLVCAFSTWQFPYHPFLVALCVSAFLLQDFAYDLVVPDDFVSTCLEDIHTRLLLLSPTIAGVPLSWIHPRDYPEIFVKALAEHIRSIGKAARTPVNEASITTPANTLTDEDQYVTSDSQLIFPSAEA